MGKLWRHIRNLFQARARLWALRRQGADPARLVLNSRRIYILPTPAGAVFGLVVATMLAGAMNYNNNLAFALAFLLAALAVTTIYHTHRTLNGLCLQLLGAEPVFAGEALDVRLSLANDLPMAREEVFLGWDRSAHVPGSVGPSASRMVRLPLATGRRGLHRLPAIQVGTNGPLGLMHAWAWVHMDATLLVWPRPSADRLPADRAGTYEHGRTSPHAGEEDFAGLRAWHTGDSPRRIAWKTFARRGELLVSDYRGGGRDRVRWLDWAHLPPADTEQRVAWLTRQVLDAAAQDVVWGLRLPGIEVGPASGREHLRACLRHLATVAAP